MNFSEAKQQLRRLKRGINKVIFPTDEEKVRSIDSAQKLKSYLESSFSSFKSFFHEDNWDTYRVEYTDNPGGMQPRIGHDADLESRARAEVLRNTDSIYQVFNLLSDDHSRALYIRLLQFRVLGHRHVKLQTNRLYYHEAFKVSNAYIKRFKIGLTGHFSHFDIFRNWLHYYEIPFADDTLRMDNINIHAATNVLLKQYYFERYGKSVCPEKSDVILDLGACWGESALAFASSAGKAGKVIAFEFDPYNLEILERNLNYNPELKERIEVVKIAASNQQGETFCFQGGPATRILSENQVVQQYGSDRTKWPDLILPIKMTTIDALVDEKRLNRVDYIKMDIEGAEPEALDGARKTIQTFNPKLGISIYHKLNHLWEIPLQIHAIQPKYKFYLDHYSIEQSESVIYCKV